MTWRLTIQTKDQSSTVGGTVNTDGAMLVRSPKGRMTPFYVSPGNETAIINQCGTPSVNYPDIWEAIQYNKTSGIWLTCPYDSANDTAGGVLVTEAGTVPLASGINVSTGVGAYTFSTVTAPVTETLTSSDYTTYTKVLTFNALTPQTALSILVNGVNQSLTVGVAVSSVYPITGTGVTTGSQYDDTTKTLTIVFTAAKTASAVVTASYSATVNAYFVLASNNPYATDDLGVQVTRNASSGLFTITVSRKLSNGSWKYLEVLTVGYTPTAVDGYGRNVYIQNIITSDTDIYLSSLSNTTLSSTTFINDTAPVAFSGGSRTTSYTAALYKTALDNFQNVAKYPVGLFMDNTGDSSIPAEFDTLSTYQPFAYFILSMPLGLVPSTAISTKQGYSINNSNMAFYWNRARIQDTYNNGSYWTSLIGRVGQKFAAMYDIFDGGSPMWIDENKHGGQLGSGIIEMEVSPSETDLKNLDAAGINPVIFDPSNGVMIVSDKTAQDPNNLSDTSFIPHARLFNYIKRNIVSQVLVFQIGKLNDDLHQRTAKTKGYSILNPITTASLLAQAGVQCDSTNNDATALAARQFVYTVAVKVTPYSETILFEFVNVGQTVSISQYIGNLPSAA